MDNRFGLDGKVALVTGAAAGLGKAMAEALAGAGASVVVADINLEAAEATSHIIEKIGVKVLPVKVNVADADSVKAMVDCTIAELGTLDILVNNAGINRRGPIVELTEEDWDATINVNLKGTFLCCRAAGPILLAKNYGKVINIASLLGSVAQPNRGPYASSKGAVVQLTKVLALEWAKNRINVNAIGPGYFATELNRKLMDDPAVYNDLTSRIPMGYWAEPDQLAGPVVF
ncbi:MAG: SDR family NAD(P)-dependent oxidoreductase, partial [Methylocystaceae bacterium]